MKDALLGVAIQRKRIQLGLEEHPKCGSDDVSSPTGMGDA
jgi:hypothetical protein